jgi:small-conductance mechanosensitive channel
MRDVLHIVVARRLGISCAALAPLALILVSWSARAQRLLRDADILQLIDQTIGWYHDVAAVTQSPADSGEATLADRIRQNSTEVVRLAFDFAKTQAAIPPANAPQNTAPQNARGRTLAQSAAAAGQRAEQAQLEIDQLNQRLQTASGRARAQLLALKDEVTSEANFAKARRDALRTLAGALSSPDEGGLAAKLSDLERSIPEAAAPQQRAPEVSAHPVANVSQNFHPESAGILGLTAQVFSLSRRMSGLDQLVQETDKLRTSCDNLRAPLRTALRQVIRRGDTVAEMSESADVSALTAQRTEIDGLLGQFKQLSVSLAPLSEQSRQIAAARAGILEWRGILSQRHSSALRYLLLRVGMLALALLFIFGLSELWRRATMRYIQDVRRRRQLLLLRRIVVGLVVALFIVLSFVTEFGSLATFAGFAAAGLAVAMQTVILSVVAYFFLVGRWGVRVGDRVTISGVTGEVVEIGLFRVYLMELGGAELALQPTGRIVVFPNSVFFQPSAVFKQIPGFDYVWRTITLKLPGTADYALIERRLLAAIESIYTEYRGVVEQQHKNIQSSLNLHTAAPRPESHVRFVDSGLEMTLRYPVEIRRAAEIDDRVAREVIQQVETDSRPAVERSR